MRLRLQHGGGLHDLAALAISALRHVAGLPGFLQWMFARGAQPLDGGDALARGLPHRSQATARRLAVHVHGACAAQAHPAAEFRSG